MSEMYDVLVIGGGPAGYVAAAKASQLGGRTAIIEKSVLGGTCLNRGCIPTKNYLKTAQTVQDIKNAAGRGIKINDAGFTIDMTAVVKGKNKVVKKLTDGVGALMKANKVDVFYGSGTAVDAGTVRVVDSEGNEKILKGKSLILAGGSETLRVPIPGADSELVLTSTEILDLEILPDRLAVIGGGVIGVEMAQIFSAFGCKVTIIELAERILPFMDASVSDELAKALKKDGVDILAGVGLAEITEKAGGLELKLENGDFISADKALMCIGRCAGLSCCGDLKIDIERGRVKVNERMETSIADIYAPGDLNGMKMLAHAAFKMGEVAAINAMGGSATADMRYVPSVVYSHPEAASVGLSEEEAEAQCEVSVGLFPLAANGKALAAGASAGFVKVIADAEFGEILGVQIVGEGASEIINEAASLMAMEITVHELAEIIHGHPSVSEALMEAAADCLHKCIHLPPKKKK